MNVTSKISEIVTDSVRYTTRFPELADWLPTKQRHTQQSSACGSNTHDTTAVPKAYLRLYGSLACYTHRPVGSTSVTAPFIAWFVCRTIYRLVPRRAHSLYYKKAFPFVLQWQRWKCVYHWSTESSRGRLTTQVRTEMSWSLCCYSLGTVCI